MPRLMYLDPADGQYKELTLAGSTGPPGPAGPAGPAGPTMARYVHTQAVMSQLWTVIHNLNGHPTVVTEDAVGNVLYGTITYIDNNTLTIGFKYSITGRANCL